MSKTAEMNVMPSSMRVVGMEIALVLTGHLDTYMDQNYGYCDVARCRICLCDTNTPQRMRETSLHEVIHAVDIALKTEMSEEQVSNISRGLFAALRDSPEWAQWLLS